MSKEDYRPRLSVVLSQDTFERLNDVLGAWRVKNALFEKITCDLVKVMEKMNPQQRRFFIVSIVEGHLEPEEYIRSVREAIEK